MKDATFTGGCRIGKGLIALNASWPFATLSINSDLAALSTPFKRYEFSRENLTRITRHQGSFSIGLRFHHNNPEYNEFLVFWCFGFDKIVSALRKNGFEIET